MALSCHVENVSIDFARVRPCAFHGSGQAFLDTINTAHDGRTMGVRNEVVNPQLTLYSPTASPSRLGKAARL